jgi:hypothetical protein
MESMAWMSRPQFGRACASSLFQCSIDSDRRGFFLIHIVVYSGSPTCPGLREFDRRHYPTVLTI